jgi:hypothetical protein
MSTPFARSMALRAASASASESASWRSARSSSWRVLGGRDRAAEVRLAERLHEVAEDSRLDRAGDELALPVRGHHDDRDRPLLDGSGRAASIPSSRGIFTSRSATSGSGLAGQLRRPLRRHGPRRRPSKPAALEQPAEVEANQRLVLGDEDAPVTPASSQHEEGSRMGSLPATPATGHDMRLAGSASTFSPGEKHTLAREAFVETCLRVRRKVTRRTRVPSPDLRRRSVAPELVPAPAALERSRGPVPASAPSIPGPSSSITELASRRRAGSRRDSRPSCPVLECVLEELGEDERDGRSHAGRRATPGAAAP